MGFFFIGLYCIMIAPPFIISLNACIVVEINNKRSLIGVAAPLSLISTFHFIEKKLPTSLEKKKLVAAKFPQSDNCFFIADIFK